jgi:hypothetical protein
MDERTWWGGGGGRAGVRTFGRVGGRASGRACGLACVWARMRALSDGREDGSELPHSGLLNQHLLFRCRGCSATAPCIPVELPWHGGLLHCTLRNHRL